MNTPCPKCHGLPAGRAQECTFCDGLGFVPIEPGQPKDNELARLLDRYGALTLVELGARLEEAEALLDELAWRDCFAIPTHMREKVANWKKRFDARSKP